MACDQIMQPRSVPNGRDSPSKYQNADAGSEEKRLDIMCALMVKWHEAKGHPPARCHLASHQWMHVSQINQSGQNGTRSAVTPFRAKDITDVIVRSQSRQRHVLRNCNPQHHFCSSSHDHSRHRTHQHRDAYSRPEALFCFERTVDLAVYSGL